MSEAIIKAVQQDQVRSDRPRIDIGDTVDVHVRIIESSKERIQVFTGTVIARRGEGLEQTLTVRRIVANEGVERIFPLHSPRIAKIEVRRHGHVRRSKLYYLRERVGKKRRLADRRRKVVERGAVAHDGTASTGKKKEQSYAGAHSLDEARAKEAETEPVQAEAGRKGTD